MENSIQPAGPNRVSCQHCGHVDTRGNMHIRSQMFEQVATCPPCMKMAPTGLAAIMAQLVMRRVAA